MSEDNSHRPTWIDLKIPLWGVVVLTVGLLGQTAGLVVWGAKMDQRVAVLEQQANRSASVAEAVARMDERTKAMAVSVERIERRIDERG